MKFYWAPALVWVAAVGTGLHAAWDYETTPGGAGAVPSRWPSDSALARAPDRPTLVMLAHPKCPCTKASLEELAVVVADAQGRLRVHVLFYAPANKPKNWTETALWHAAAAIPGVTVSGDSGNIEARRFGAETSGQVVLFDKQGRLLFNGGITALRGHAGDNAGRRAVAALAAGGEAKLAKTPVLGCSLEGPRS